MKQDFISNMKHSCLMCHTYRGTQRKTDYRAVVEKSLAALKERYEKEYDVLRARDAPMARIATVKNNRRLCMDALDACRACDKGVDLVNRIAKDFAPLGD